MPDLSFWRLRGFCVPPGLRSPGGVGRWCSCWLRRSSLCLQNCSCSRRCSCTPLPSAGQATEEQNPKQVMSNCPGWVSVLVSNIWQATNVYAGLFSGIKHNDGVLHGHRLPACRTQSVTMKCKQTLCLKTSYLYILTWGLCFMLQPHW